MPSSSESGLGAPQQHLTQAITDSLTALARDAKILRELSNCRTVQNTHHPDGDIVSRQLKVHIEAKVAAIEESLNEVRGFIRDEQVAMQELETVEQDAVRCNRALKSMLEEFQNQMSRKQVQSKLLSPPCETPSTPLRDTILSALPFEAVTPAEFDSVPRTLRGRIPLGIVNDSLLDIEQLLIAKFRRPEKSSLRRYQTDEEELDDFVLLGNRLWLTEDEMRHSCAFFGHGESTARATLLILRTLGRLQQVPRKHGEFLYLVMVASPAANAV
jgi:hypothetical protein